MCSRRVEQLQLPDGFLCSVFLNRPNQNIEYNHRNKQHVSVASHKQQADCKSEIQEIEKGKQIVKQNFFQRFPLILIHRVAQAVPHAFLCLFRGQPSVVCVLKMFRPLFRKRQLAFHAHPPCKDMPILCLRIVCVKGFSPVSARKRPDRKKACFFFFVML